MRELYTFAEYLEDHVMQTAGYAINVSAKEIAVAWDLYKTSYIEYCRKEDYEHEQI